MGALAIGAGILGVGASLAGGVIGTISSLQQNQAAAEQMKYQAEIEDQNRKNYEAAAYNEAEQGAWEKRNLALKQASELGKARASFGASGTALGSGSPLLYEEDAAVANESEMRQAQYEIDNRVWQKRVGAWNSATQAEAYRMSASNTLSQRGLLAASGIMSTTGSTLSSMGSAVNLYGNVKDWNDPVANWFKPGESNSARIAKQGIPQ